MIDFLFRYLLPFSFCFREFFSNYFRIMMERDKNLKKFDFQENIKNKKALRIF